MRRVAFLNSFYFAFELAVALLIGSVSLLADSIDFAQDASVNLIILAGLRWTALYRARLGMALSLALLIPAAATAWQAWEKLFDPVAPLPLPLSLTAAGALVVNFSCAHMLARFRSEGSSLLRAASLSARNDALANAAIICAGLVTAYAWRTGWPDFIVGLGIAALNADAGREVWTTARREHQEARGSGSPPD